MANTGMDFESARYQPNEEEDYTWPPRGHTLPTAPPRPFPEQCGAEFVALERRVAALERHATAADAATRLEQLEATVSELQVRVQNTAIRLRVQERALLDAYTAQQKRIWALEERAANDERLLHRLLNADADAVLAGDIGAEQ